MYLVGIELDSISMDMYNVCKDVLQRFQFHLKGETTELPSTVLSFVGIELDSISMDTYYVWMDVPQHVYLTDAQPAQENSSLGFIEAVYQQ